MNRVNQYEIKRNISGLKSNVHENGRVVEQTTNADKVESVPVDINKKRKLGKYKGQIDMTLFFDDDDMIEYFKVG
ncbi:MAG: hypothetical protein SFH39_07365 [Candidatus Magnetobacterium sp. LHC-1]|nr:hypothetical protein [Nitrospirota bacterium]